MLHSPLLQTSVPGEQQPLVVRNLVGFATACGALACTKEGAIAAQPTFNDVQEFIDSSDSGHVKRLGII